MRAQVSRIITGDGLHKTRLHNYGGQIIDLAGFGYLPLSILTTIALKCFHFHFRLPWLGWRAIRHLDHLIQPNWKILEFGSGMSSVWFARRCKLLVSMESDAQWFEKISTIFKKEKLTNIEYSLKSPEDYIAVKDFPDAFFDLVLVDGLYRDQCAKTALRKVKDGRYIYLDNSDVPYGEFQMAKQTLLSASEDTRYFIDFYPFQIAVAEGLLIQRPLSISK